MISAQARVDDQDVGDADCGGAEEPADEQRAAADRPHDQRLKEAALGVAADYAQRQKGGEDGAEEEGPEHREAEERAARELVLLDRQALIELGDFLERRVRAQPVEAEVEGGQNEHDVEDPAAERLLEGVAGDDRERPHAVSPPTASRYSSSRLVARTRTP